MMREIRVGVDLAKSVFQVHGVDRSEKPVWRRKLNRTKWLKVVRQTVPLQTEIGMDACGGAHHWARQLQAIGYRVKLIAPQFVKPYVKSNRAMIRMAKNKARSDPLSLWVMRIASNRRPKVAAVALANKTVRIAWAMIRHETDYQPALAKQAEPAPREPENV
jgi:transposase